MGRELLFSVVAFLLGTSAGAIAFGERGGLPAFVAPAPVTAPGTLATGADAPEKPPVLQAVSDTEAAPGPVRGAAADTVAPAEPVAPLTPALVGGAQQLEILVARWASLEGEVARVQRRLGTLEKELARVRAELPLEPPGDAGKKSTKTLPSDTPEQRRSALLAAGVPDIAADDIVWREAQLDMERLELQDRAIRENWYRTERYYEELRALSNVRVDLRAEIGDEAYDRYLFSIGETNRVQVSSVIPGSPAEQAGLMPGDVIESYGGERLFRFSDLRTATTEGERDEVVALQVRRGDTLVETWVPRGPMGVRLDASQRPPDY